LHLVLHGLLKPVAFCI